MPKLFDQRDLVVKYQRDIKWLRTRIEEAYKSIERDKLAIAQIEEKLSRIDIRFHPPRTRPDNKELK